jgi:hypothetical protein
VSASIAFGCEWCAFGVVVHPRPRGVCRNRNDANRELLTLFAVQQQMDEGLSDDIGDEYDDEFGGYQK